MKASFALQKTEFENIAIEEHSVDLSEGENVLL